MDEFQLWYSTLIPGIYYISKDKLEDTLWGKFRDKSPEERYSTIFYRTFWRETVE